MNVTETVLLKYFTNELDKEERLKVEDWINETEENYQLAKDAYLIFFSMETLDIIRNTHTDIALYQVNKKIRNNNVKQFFLWIQKIAVVLFVPLLIVTVYMSQKNIPNHAVTYVEMKSGSGMTSTFELPDGSTVWLNSGSIIRYPSLFTGKTRNVFLNGEGYFSITKNIDQPFVVSTSSDLCVEVLGTEFNLDAYEDNDWIVTSLVEGSIRLSYNQDGQSDYIVMEPNQQIAYNRSSHVAYERTTYIPQDIAWKDGRIVLQDTPLEQLLWMLEKRFCVKFEIKNDNMKENCFTGIFDNQTLVQVLEHLKISSKINYQFENIYSEETIKSGTNVILF